MATPPIPPSLLQVAARPFCFYPAIIGVEHNEWLFRKGTWQEYVFVNSRDGAEVSIPRRFVGELTPAGGPVTIIGLVRELQFRDGAISPYHRRVIEMPVAVGDTGLRTAPARRATPAPVVNIRLEPPRGRRILKLAGGALAISIFLVGATANLMRLGDSKQRIGPKRHSHPTLSPGDTYDTVVRNLGPPLSDRWRTDGSATYHYLVYPQFTAVLIGFNGARPGYAGSLDESRTPGVRSR